MNWPLPPGADEREAARREFDAVWGRPENRVVLEQQRQLSPVARYVEVQAAERRLLAEAMSEPTETDTLTRIYAEHAVRTAKQYVWGPDNEAEVQSRLQADVDAARRAAAEDARLLASMPGMASIWFGAE